MALQDVGWGGMDWLELAQVVDACELCTEPSGSIKCRKLRD